MKNKGKIGIIVGVAIILVVIGVLIILLKPEEKLTIVKIVDNYGREIEDYKENKMAFCIENSQGKVKVNGKEYKEGQRFYKPGKYKVEVTNGKEKEWSIVNIKKIERSKQSEYNVYITTEIMDALFASMQVVKEPDAKGYFWTERSSSINIDVLKENLPHIQMSEYNGETNENNFIKQVLPEARSYIQKILQEDENAYFHLYTNDLRFYLELDLLGKEGLDDSRYDTTLYTNGTLSYVREYEICEQNKYERFLEEKRDYLEIVDNIKSNTGNYNDHMGSYLTDAKSPVFGNRYNYDYMLVSTLAKNNITYELQYPDKIKFQDEKISKEMQKANLHKIVAQEKYNELSEKSKEIFFKTINLDKKELDEKYFQEESDKYLIVTGTIPFYGIHGKQEEFEAIMKRVCQDYKEEYTILYKPHPRELPDEEQEKFLNSLDIKVLPGRIPMEAIMFIYPNIQIGGFASSLYMSADEGKTEFFFAREARELVSPLDELYDSLFKEAKFYYDEVK